MTQQAARVIAAALVLGGLGRVSPALAHPGWGLVRDAARGIVYYTDLVRVWKIDRTGRRTVAVPDVHTHELRLDAQGNLYGEDLENNGDRWRNRVWRLSPDGRLTDVLPWRPGFRDDYGFVADANGALYWTKCSVEADRCVVNRRAANGQVSAAGRGRTFARPLNFLASDDAGGVLLADGNSILRLTPADTFASAIRNAARTNDRFAIMGFHPRDSGEITVAAFEDGTVVRLTPARPPQVLYRAEGPWKPSAVLDGPDGLWITEYDGARVRLRHRDATGRERTWGPD
ncbi:MAG: hypothetical protein ACKVZ0_03315 [Gemmatimonadales bacterium]